MRGAVGLGPLGGGRLLEPARGFGEGIPGGHRQGERPPLGQVRTCVCVYMCVGACIRVEGAMALQPERTSLVHHIDPVK